jgi:transcriptional regulator with XRE-family HTH domain
MVNENDSLTLGDVVREARNSAKLSLRDLAKRINKTPSYISDIENDRRIPSEDVIRDIAKVLNLEFDEIMALAGRLGSRAERYIKRHPIVGVLLRRISDGNLQDEDLKKLLQQVERLTEKRRGN